MRKKIYSPEQYSKLKQAIIDWLRRNSRKTKSVENPLFGDPKNEEMFGDLIRLTMR